MANSAGTGSAQSWGAAAWPPSPLTVILKPLAAAIMGPAHTPNEPAGRPGQLCMPNTASQGKRVNRPSWIMARPPAPPSSAGWKHRYTVPSKPPAVCRWRAAASSMAVWPSWPQPCILPSWRDRWSNWFSSCMGRASMSARSMIARSDVPCLITPTTPVLAMPVCVSMPQLRSVSATTLAVRCSS
ncbi:hypothetical protein G6F23_014518 [Rhizopus arrhizus]|nr:hypothetical protein G6F23_014518 [Rhizopus arrhizus]